MVSHCVSFGSSGVKIGLVKIGLVNYENKTTFQSTAKNKQVHKSGNKNQKSREFMKFFQPKSLGL